MKGLRTGLARLAAGVLCLAMATIAGGAGSAAANPDGTAIAPPVITAAPTSRTVPSGGNVTFHAATAGPATVRWQRSTDGGLTWVDLPGQTSTTLSLAAVTTAQNGHRFRAVFTDPDGSTATGAATLAVVAPAPTTRRTTSPAPLAPAGTDADPVEPPSATSPRVITVRPEAPTESVAGRARQDADFPVIIAALIFGAVVGLTGGILIGGRRRSRGSRGTPGT